MRRAILFVAIAACHSSDKPPGDKPAPATTGSAGFDAVHVALTGAPATGVAIDYSAYDARTDTVWVPAGNGSVYVIANDRSVTAIPGWATKQVERDGKQRMMGPSSAAVGSAGVYIGNRGDASVCLVDDKALSRGTCATLDSSPDGLAYDAGANELWVTTPRDHSLRVLDGTTLAQKARIALDGQPEGFAIDAVRHRFYTNLEDKDQTIAVTLATRTVDATWSTGCGADGGRGMRLLAPAGQLVIACGATARVLDVGHDGALLSALPTVDGVDDIDVDPNGLAIFAGGKAGALTYALLAGGVLKPLSVLQTAPGARNAVFGSGNVIYLPHGSAGEVIVLSETAKNVEHPR